MRAEVIFQHGWGFDGQTFMRWLPQLEQDGLDVQIGERGYFGATYYVPGFSQFADYKVVIAHSLGLHLLSAETIEAADALVLISTFAHFHPDDKLANKRSKRVVRTMREKLSVEPHTVLRDFVRSCYQPEFTDVACPWPHALLNTTLLESDLDLLDSNIFDVNTLQGKNVLLLYAADDEIVPISAAETFVANLPSARLVRFENAGHSLPLTQPERCLLAVTSLLSPLKEARYSHVSSASR